MNDIETEGDPQYWLSSKRLVINAQRKAARNIVMVEGDRGGKEFRSIVYPLDFYVARRHISAEQYKAGDRLRSIFNLSILRERYVRMNYGDVGGNSDGFDMALAPRDFLKAMEAIRRDRDKTTVRVVCCEEKNAGKRGGMDSLKAGLDDLVKHFKIHD
jgi:hypothetical protein